MPVSIRFVSIVGRNNAPLYLRAFDNKESSANNDTSRDTSKDELRYHFLSHMALDYVYSQLQYAELASDYALLMVHDGIAVYGTLTNTGVKVLIGTDAHENVRFDLKSTIRSIHKAYIGYICNPFHEVEEEEDEEIQSKAFDRAISNVVEAWNTAAGSTR